MEEKRRENVVAGAVGAFLGALIGVVCTVVIGQLGYVASVSGLIMAVCALKGYELLGGALSRKGAAIASVLILVMTYFAHRLTWAAAIMSAFEGEVGLLEAFRAIPQMLEEGMLEGPAYWGDLAMLYLFTLLGAVPTIISGLRSTAMPDLPAGPVPEGLEGNGGEDAVLYPARREWMRPLRVSASLSMLPGLLGGCVLLAAAVSRDASIPLSMAALGCIAGAFVMMCVAFPAIQLSQADGFLFVRTAGMLWRVNLGGLNTMDTYRFTRKSVSLRALRWDKLTTEEQERARASVLRAISLLSSGQVMPGSSLSLMVMPLTDFQLIRETEWCWKGTYALQGGKQKKLSIPKAYPSFVPTYGLEPPQGPAPFRWSLLVLAVTAALLLGAAGGGLGRMLEGSLPGGRPAASAGKDDALTAREPASASSYETDGVRYQVDSTFLLTSVNTFYDPGTNTNYQVAVQYGVDEEQAVDALLRPIGDYRMSPRYEGFVFAHAGAEETLVPLTAADGTIYQHELLSLHLADGEAVHVGAALSGNGMLVTVEAHQTAGADEETVLGNILYILESIQCKEPAQVEITGDNYQDLFHLAEELDFTRTAVGYVKAPYDMFGRETFVDVHVPFSGEPVYLEDGGVLRSAAHGMEVAAGITASDGNAEAVVDQAYEAMAASGLDIYEDGVTETVYFEEYDIAVKQVAYLEEDGTKVRIAILYADRKQEGFYLSAQITYMPEQLDDAYPELRLELSAAYALTLPEIEPMDGA